MMFSFIIPCKKDNKYLRECIKQCSSLKGDFEVLVLPDEDFSLRSARVIKTGAVPPSFKRNIGIKNSKGDFCVFIDDDAYPDKNYLKNAVKYFKKNSVIAIGGPQLTPPDDSLFQRAGGAVLSSFLGGGGFSARYSSRESFDVDDWPSVNLIIRKSVLRKVGGCPVNYWPGEDTVLCLNLSKHGRIVYAPDVRVFHHRRPLFRPHLRQIWSYANQRGFFVKKFPETSRRISYFLPSFLVIGLILGIILSFFNAFVLQLSIIGLAAYSGACLASGLMTKSLKMSFLVALGIMLTHLTYGIGFLKGLLSRSMEWSKKEKRVVERGKVGGKN